MKPQATKQPEGKRPHTAMPAQQDTASASRKSPPRAQPSFDDLHARIAVRAYELYVQRGYREGSALEDWLDAEREILAEVL